MIRNGVRGRMVFITGWTQTFPNGHQVVRPDHWRFRPFDIQGTPGVRPKPALVEPPAEVEAGEPGGPVEGQEVTINGVRGRYVRISAYNKIIGSKFIMVPAKLRFMPWDRAPRGPRGSYKKRA